MRSEVARGGFQVVLHNAVAFVRRRFRRQVWRGTTPTPFSRSLTSLAFGPTLEPVSTLGFVLLILVWMVPGLIGHHPWKPDEGYTFGLVRHIAATGDWIVPMLGNEPFLEKPPLYFTVAAASLKLFGGLLSEHDAARLASGLFIAIACAGVATSANAAIGRHAGRWAIVILLGCIGLPVRAHQMITDTALFAGVALGMAGLVMLTQRRISAGPLLGAGAAMAFMAKGLLGPGVLVVSALIVAACMLIHGGGTRVVGTLLLTLGAALGVFLPLPLYWTATLWREAPDLFETWWFVNNVGRFTGDNDLGPTADPAFYFKILPWYAFPALPLALCIGRARSWSVLSSPLGAVAILAAVTLAVLSLAADARELYAMPVLAPLAVLAAAGLLRLDVRAALRPRLAHVVRVLGSAFACLVVLLIVGVWCLVWTLWHGSLSAVPSPMRERLAELVGGISLEDGHAEAAAGFAALVAFIIAGLWLRRTGAVASALVWRWTLLVTLFWGTAMTLCLPWLDASKRYAEVYATLAPGFASAHAEGSCVATLSLGEAQRALIPYYLDGTFALRIETMPAAAACRWLLFHGASANVPAILHGHIPVIDAFRPGNQRIERFLLYRLPFELGTLAAYPRWRKTD
jgi:4-amino-4-deoxy-L-arabinose transferase-like glycosyltransferase